MVTIDGITYYIINGDYYVRQYQDNKVVYVVVERPPAPANPEVLSDSSYPDPFEVVKNMSTFLGEQKTFTLVVDDTYDDKSIHGMDVQRSSRRLVYVTRPDKLAVQYEGSDEQLEIIYNGQELSIVNIGQNTYSTVAMPKTIDTMLDEMSGKYGITVPIADFLYSNPADAMLPGTRSGQYIGTSEIDSVKCHHIAFSNDDIDWELWVETGDKPLPRKLVITYKNEKGKPRYIMTPQTWELGTVPASAYELKIPDNAKKVQMEPMKPAEENKQAISLKN